MITIDVGEVPDERTGVPSQAARRLASTIDDVGEAEDDIDRRPQGDDEPHTDGRPGITRVFAQPQVVAG